MRIIHLADLHFRRDTYDESAASIHAVADDIEANGADLVAISGDIWDGPVQNTAGARFTDFLELIGNLANYAPVAMIYGTPSHDTDGSLEVFEEIKADHGITILQPGASYFMARGEISSVSTMDDDVMLFGVPEPNKKWLLANGGATGKDDADTIVRDFMRALFLGLGGMRKEHPELPCVLLYHGQVSGARTGTGYKAGSGIAVSKDDLAQVGADYIALGDIHEPQQIQGIPAYYPGSIVPQNWGETHKAGANVVEIRDSVAGDLFGSGVMRTVDVGRIEFPHPRRMKLSLLSVEGIGADLPKVPANIWYEVTCTRDEAAAIDTEALTASIIAHGALPGSRVTLNIIPTETVRAGDIAEKKSLREKVIVWGENSAQEIPASVLAKADDLERESARGASGDGAHIRIDRLHLRGAIGIWKKSRKDEIDLDLSAAGAGVIAFVGPNGAGKTTIIENLHPWPRMLTRDGTLKDHFRLKDSFRDLYFTDERTGWKYRAQITIRADIVSGAAEYFLFVDKGQGFEPMPGINGRKEPYEAAIAELFGSLEMYLRTAFVTQRPTKNAPEISEATKGERKALFAELAGIEYLDGYRATAKASADAIESETRILDANIQAGQGVDEEIAGLMTNIEDATIKADEARCQAEAVQAEGAILKAEADTIRVFVAQLDRKADRQRSLEREIAGLIAEIESADRDIVGFSEAVTGRDAAVEELANIKALEAEAAKLREEKSLIDKANHDSLVEHQALTRTAETKRREAQAALDSKRKALSENERSLAACKARLSAPIVDTCPTCGQMLQEEKRDHLVAERAKIENEAKRIYEAMSSAIADVSAEERTLAEIVYPAAPVAQPFQGSVRLAELDGLLAFANADALREIIRKADEAAVRIEAAEGRKQSNRTRIAVTTIEAADLRDEVAEGAPTREMLPVAERKLEQLRAEFIAASNAEASAKASVQASQGSLERARIRKAQRDEAITRKDTLDAQVVEWRLLERACGPDGIQALELDALAPGIMAIANRLLEEAYGARYKAEIRTTRIAGKGSKTKQVEDFEIWILDSETGEEQEIATLSGGESVWVKRALYDAFAIIRARNTGVKFLTACQDEADGALDPDARMKYLRMLEAAHAESGRYQTLIITHSTELQAMASKTIDVATL